jgi:hypothetical protein
MTRNLLQSANAHSRVSTTSEYKEKKNHKMHVKLFCFDYKHVYKYESKCNFSCFIFFVRLSSSSTFYVSLAYYAVFCSYHNFDCLKNCDIKSCNVLTENFDNINFVFGNEVSFITIDRLSDSDPPYTIIWHMT